MLCFDWLIRGQRGGFPPQTQSNFARDGDKDLAGVSCKLLEIFLPLILMRTELRGNLLHFLFLCIHGLLDAENLVEGQTSDGIAATLVGGPLGDFDCHICTCFWLSFKSTRGDFSPRSVGLVIRNHYLYPPDFQNEFESHILKSA